MDIKKIKAIVDLVKQAGIAELEISEGEDKLRVSCINSNMIVQQPAPQVNYPQVAVTNTPQQPVTQAVNHSVEVVAPSPVAANVIRSPMVGTFYASSSPTSKPFVSVGDVVKKGQVLCIIEAMKLMNQIESDKDGEIVAILVNNASAVEYDQALFEIR